MWRASVLIILSLLLASCQSDTSREYLLTHPQYTAKLYLQCQKQSAPFCKKVERAVRYMSHEALLIKANPQAYGLNILLNQMNIAKLSQLLQDESDATKRGEISAKLQEALAERRRQMAMIRWLESVD